MSLLRLLGLRPAPAPTALTCPACNLTRLVSGGRDGPTSLWVGCRCGSWMVPAEATGRPYNWARHGDGREVGA